MMLTVFTIATVCTVATVYTVAAAYTVATVSEVGGVKPQVPPSGKSSSELDVFALSRYAYASRERDRSITRGADLA